ncbi:hypothetical protein DIPPA_25316 [Diplonema papillatum]|nr:hypothetical protein DIPPA_25316 [Diplonema papillatum]
MQGHTYTSPASRSAVDTDVIEKGIVPVTRKKFEASQSRASADEDTGLHMSGAELKDTVGHSTDASSSGSDALTQTADHKEQPYASFEPDPGWTLRPEPVSPLEDPLSRSLPGASRFHPTTVRPLPRKHSDKPLDYPKSPTAAKPGLSRPSPLSPLSQSASFSNPQANWAFPSVEDDLYSNKTHGPLTSESASKEPHDDSGGSEINPDSSPSAAPLLRQGRSDSKQVSMHGLAPEGDAAWSAGLGAHKSLPAHQGKATDQADLPSSPHRAPEDDDQNPTPLAPSAPACPSGAQADSRFSSENDPTCPLSLRPLNAGRSSPPLTGGQPREEPKHPHTTTDPNGPNSDAESDEDPRFAPERTPEAAAPFENRFARDQEGGAPPAPAAYEARAPAAPAAPASWSASERAEVISALLFSPTGGPTNRALPGSGVGRAGVHSVAKGPEKTEEAQCDVQEDSAYPGACRENVHAEGESGESIPRFPSEQTAETDVWQKAAHANSPVATPAETWRRESGDPGVPSPNQGMRERESWQRDTVSNPAKQRAEEESAARLANPGEPGSESRQSDFQASPVREADDAQHISNEAAHRLADPDTQLPSREAAEHENRPTRIHTSPVRESDAVQQINNDDQVDPRLVDSVTRFPSRVTAERETQPARTHASPVREHDWHIDSDSRLGDSRRFPNRGTAEREPKQTDADAAAGRARSQEGHDPESEAPDSRVSSLFPLGLLPSRRHNTARPAHDGAASPTRGNAGASPTLPRSGESGKQRDRHAADDQSSGGSVQRNGGAEAQVAPGDFFAEAPAADTTQTPAPPQSRSDPRFSGPGLPSSFQLRSNEASSSPAAAHPERSDRAADGNDLFEGSTGARRDRAGQFRTPLRPYSEERDDAGGSPNKAPFNPVVFDGVSAARRQRAGQFRTPLQPNFEEREATGSGPAAASFQPTRDGSAARREGEGTAAARWERAAQHPSPYPEPKEREAPGSDRGNASFNPHRGGGDPGGDGASREAAAAARWERSAQLRSTLANFEQREAAERPQSASAQTSGRSRLPLHNHQQQPPPPASDPGAEGVAEAGAALHGLFPLGSFKADLAAAAGVRPANSLGKRRERSSGEVVQDAGRAAGTERTENRWKMDDGDEPSRGTTANGLGSGPARAGTGTFGGDQSRLPSGHWREMGERVRGRQSNGGDGEELGISGGDADLMWGEGRCDGGEADEGDDSPTARFAVNVKDLVDMQTARPLGRLFADESNTDGPGSGVAEQATAPRRRKVVPNPRPSSPPSTVRQTSLPNLRNFYPNNSAIFHPAHTLNDLHTRPTPPSNPPSSTTSTYHTAHTTDSKFRSHTADPSPTTHVQTPIEPPLPFPSPSDGKPGAPFADAPAADKGAEKTPGLFGRLKKRFSRGDDHPGKPGAPPDAPAKELISYEDSASSLETASKLGESFGDNSLAEGGGAVCSSCKGSSGVLVCEGCWEKKEKSFRDEAHAECIARATLDGKCMQLREENVRLNAKLRAFEAECQQIGNELMDAGVLIDRQDLKITELTEEVSMMREKQKEHFDTVEELAEMKVVAKSQQRRIEDLFSEVNDEKRARKSSEEWLLQLRDQCLRFKGAVEERDELRDHVRQISMSYSDEKRRRTVIQERYSHLWERHESTETELAHVRSDLEAVTRAWHKAVGELTQARDTTVSLQRWNDHLRKKLTDAGPDKNQAFAEAIAALASTGIDMLPDTQVDALTGNLSAITEVKARHICSAMAPNPATAIKKLMAALHPDRTSIPACKETLQKRFQLLGHLKMQLQL